MKTLPKISRKREPQEDNVGGGEVEGGKVKGVRVEWNVSLNDGASCGEKKKGTNWREKNWRMVSLCLLLFAFLVMTVESLVDYMGVGFTLNMERDDQIDS